VQDAVKNAGFEFRLAMTWPDYAATQLLALAPAGLAPALLEIAQDGFCYDQSLPAVIERRLRTWMQAHGLWTEAWLGEKPAGYPFALTFVRSNVTPKFLFKQFQAARRDEDGGFCLGGACLACGACATTAERKRQTGHRLHKPADRDWLKKFTALMDAKAKLKPVYGRFRLAPELAGATPAWLNACAMRELLHALPDQAENLLGLREILFTAGDNAARWPVFSGETIFLLKAWDTDKLLSALAGFSSEPIRWLGQVAPVLGKDSTPVFQTLDIELRLPAGLFPDAAAVFLSWLRTRRIAFNLRRTDRGLSLQLDPKKKNFLSAALLEQATEGTLLRLTAGPAFDLADFFAASGDPNLARQADVRITRLELKP